MEEQPELQTPPPFRVEFERTGGFAGMRVAAAIDSTKLPPEDARQLEENLAAAGFFHLPPRPASPAGGADSFHYRITVEEGGRKHTVECGESAAPEALQPLLRQLTLLARQGNRE
jgi:hypothetical protein